MLNALVFRQLRRRLQQLLRLRGEKPEDIEDVIQDAFLRLELYYRRGREVREPEAFLVRTALRLSMNAKRGLQRRVNAENLVADLPHFHLITRPDDALAVQQSIDTIRLRLSKVPDSTRDVFLLHRRDGYTYPQIAKLYGMTTKAVERRIARAMVAVFRGSREAIGLERISK